MIEIIPAILTSDPDDLKKKFHQVQKFARAVQIDIGDGKFIPTTTINFEDLEDVSPDLFLEIHLMVAEPEKYLLPFVQIGAKRIIFHFESSNNPLKVAQRIKELGIECGVALSPSTSLEKIRELDWQIDEILLLAVEPGKQGQEFQDSAISRICEIREIYPEAIIGVDGGINKNNINLISRSGANIAVVGKAIFGEADPQKAYQEIRKICDET